MLLIWVANLASGVIRMVFLLLQVSVCPKLRGKSVCNDVFSTLLEGQYYNLYTSMSLSLLRKYNYVLYISCTKGIQICQPIISYSVRTED